MISKQINLNTASGKLDNLKEKITVTYFCRLGIYFSKLGYSGSDVHKNSSDNSKINTNMFKIKYTNLLVVAIYVHSFQTNQQEIYPENQH